MGIRIKSITLIIAAGLSGWQCWCPHAMAQDSLNEKVDLAAQTIMGEQHLPGLAVVVVESGKTVFCRGYGLANVERGVSVDPEKTLFRIGSVSKALTFLVLTRMVDQGLIKRSDNVEDFIGTLPNPSGFDEPVTIDHLLTHTGGFDQIGIGRHIHEHHLDLAERKTRRPSLTEFLLANNLRRVTAPGELFRYDTYGTTLAGVIIEKVTGLKFAEAMDRELFSPLGMSSSFVEAADESFADLATGYGWRNDSFQPRPYEVYATTPASSIDSTPADMGRLLEALTADGANVQGRLISPKTCQAVLAPQFRSHSEFVGITHGFFESTLNREGTNNIDLRTIGHGGSMDGYRSALTIVPDRNLGIFITANRATESGGGRVNFQPVFDAIIESKIRDAPVTKPLAVPESMEANLDEYSGDYYYGTFCHSMTSEDASRGAWRRGDAHRVLVVDHYLMINDERFLPRGDDVFVQAGGERMAYFGRNSEGAVSHFLYSTSPDTFEKEFQASPFPDYQSMAQRVFEIASSEDGQSAIRFFESNHSSGEFYINEQEMNNVGYALLQMNRVADAVLMFEQNVKSFPKSWNACDSLGEAYARLGNKSLAIRYYEKSLQLNPKNEEGRARLAELKSADL